MSEQILHPLCCSCCDRLAAAERALREIGNIVGGPTMTYAPTVEIQEWRRRADRISELVATTVAYSSERERSTWSAHNESSTNPSPLYEKQRRPDLNFSDRKEGE